MRRTLLTLIAASVCNIALAGPYAPPAGQPGSTAIANTRHCSRSQVCDRPSSDTPMNPRTSSLRPLSTSVIFAR